MEKYQNLLQAHLQSGEFIGAVVGEYREGEEKYISAGYSDLEIKKDMSVQSAFEIGSITKVFTGLLIQIFEDEGLLSLEGKVSQYIERLAPYEVGNIIIRDLLTHYSGLKRLPENFTSADWLNPYASYDLESFLNLINEEKLGPRQFEYSNQGMALLGVIVDHIYKPGYEQAIYDFIITPLGLTQTFFERNKYENGVLAKGYQPGGVPQVYWDFKSFCAAGALKSTAKDLLKFSKAYIFPESTSLSKSIKKQLLVLEEEVEVKRLNAWWMSKDSQYIYHGGATFGFKSELFIDLKNKASLVLLSNTYDLFEGYISTFKGEEFKPKVFLQPTMDLLSKIVGKFKSRENDDFIFNYFVFNNQLYLRLDGQLAGRQEWKGDCLFVEESLNVSNLYDEITDTILFKQDKLTLTLKRIV